MSYVKIEHQPGFDAVMKAIDSDWSQRSNWSDRMDSGWKVLTDGIWVLAIEADGLEYWLRAFAPGA